MAKRALGIGTDDYRGPALYSRMDPKNQKNPPLPSVSAVSKLLRLSEQ